MKLGRTIAYAAAIALAAISLAGCSPRCNTNYWKDADFMNSLKTFGERNDRAIDLEKGEELPFVPYNPPCFLCPEREVPER